MLPIMSGYGLYILISLPALLLGLWAQFKVKSAFEKYSRIRTTTGLTGQEIARKMLNASGLGQVRVEETQGFLSDHYDPSQKVLRLSPNVYRSNSLAAAGVAAHDIADRSDGQGVLGQTLWWERVVTGGTTIIRSSDAGE